MKGIPVINSFLDFITGKYRFFRLPGIGIYGKTGFLTHHPFSESLYYSIIDILIDLVNDITLVNNSTNNTVLFADFKTFVEFHGEQCLHILFKKGYCVVGYDGTQFIILRENITDSTGFNKREVNGEYIFTPFNNNLKTYVLTSKQFELTGRSDYDVLKSWLNYADDLMNASNTVLRRLGNLLIISPRSISGSIIEAEISKDDKELIEKEISEKYGQLAHQKQALILPRPSDIHNVGLANIDLKLLDKLRVSILVICTYFKLPTAQIPLIEADMSKGLQNGGEMFIGDLLKYKTFERLFNRTFMRMAFDVGLNVSYTLYNKPVAPVAASTEPGI